VAVAAGEVDLVPVRMRLAWYMATSARCSSPIASSAWFGKSAMPTLASMWTWMPPTANDSSSAARSRRPAVLAVTSSPGLEDDRELVAAQPRERVVLAQQLLQPRADLAQHLVAGVVAERVVELLEAVEVDQQQGELVAVGAARLDRRVQRVDQVAAVAEAR
jgi:hypothetical protein